LKATATNDTTLAQVFIIKNLFLKNIQIILAYLPLNPGCLTVRELKNPRPETLDTKPEEKRKPQRPLLSAWQIERHRRRGRDERPIRLKKEVTLIPEFQALRDRWDSSRGPAAHQSVESWVTTSTELLGGLDGVKDRGHQQFLRLLPAVSSAAVAAPSVCITAIPRAASLSMRASFLPLPMAAALACPNFSSKQP
jgi:hypothetical protein